jgi:hypothetical protein
MCSFMLIVGDMSYILTNRLQPGGDPHVLCFVDFDNPAQATIALEALQGEHAYICGCGLFACVVILVLSLGETQFSVYIFIDLYYIRLHLSLFCSQACWGAGNHTHISLPEFLQHRLLYQITSYHRSQLKLIIC